MNQILSPLLATAMCLLLSLLAAPLAAQVSTEDRHFPVIVDPEQLPAGAVMRIGQKGERTTFMGVYDICFSPDGKVIALKGRDHVVRLFDLKSGQKICEVDGHENRVRAVEFAPDSSSFVTVGFGEADCVIIWETATGKELKRFSYGGEELVYSQDGKFLHVIRDQRLDRIKIDDGSTTKLLNWSRSEQGIGLSRDGYTVATALNRETPADPIYFNSYRNGTIERYGISTQRPNANQVVFSQSGNWFLARFDRQRQVNFWSGDRPHKLKELGIHETDVYSISSSYDDRFFLTTARDGGAFLWDAVAGKHVFKIEGHADSSNIVSSEFSPDGKWFATGASGRKDSSLLVWDLKKTLFPRLDAQPQDVGEASIEAIWDQLASPDPKIAYAAIQDYVIYKERAGTRFHERIMKSTNVVGSERIVELIAQLDDPRYSVRAEATENLLKLRNVAESLLQDAIQQTKSVEVRYRISLILKTPLEKPKLDPPDYRRLQRLIHALEYAGDERSKQLLGALSQGHPHIEISRAAQSALNRQ